MASVRRLYGHWRANGYRYIYHPQIFHLYLISYDGLSCYHLFFRCILDEYQTVHFECEEEPVVVPIRKSKVKSQKRQLLNIMVLNF